MERMWNKKDISKEEMKVVNQIVRCYRYFLGAYREKKISPKEFNFYKAKCIFALNLAEYYFDEQVTDKRDFDNWLEGFKQYQEFRKVNLWQN